MYSEEAKRHFEQPRHSGVLTDASVIGRAGVQGRGNFMVLYLRLDPEETERVVDSRFLTYGCPAAIASGSWVADWLIGKSLADAAGLQSCDVETGLGGLPLGKEHCAPLAVAAVRDALRQLSDSALSNNLMAQDGATPA